MKSTFNCPVIRLSGVVYEKLLMYEKGVFLLFLLVTLLQLWLTKYVPSLDGPQHLYNANVLANLVKGNPLINEFFTLNDTIVGYWTAHGLLGFFTLFLPSWLAEKIFLTTYVLGMIFAFRYLVRSINPGKGNFAAFLIFPFVYHMFILMGYYAFSFAAIFFFLGFGYFIRNRSAFRLKHMMIFGLLLVLLFLTHGLIYVFFLLSLSIYVLSTMTGTLISGHTDSIQNSAAPGTRNMYFRSSLQLIIKIVVAALPSLILWYVYIRKVIALDSTVSETSFSLGELTEFLLRIRQLVGFHHELEAVGYIPLVVLMILLGIVFFVLFAGRLKDRSARWSDLLDQRNTWLILALFFLALYFLAPNRISAGSLTHRFGLYFFFMLITWLSMHRWPKTFQVIAVVVILFSITFSRATHHRFYVNLNKDIRDLTELTEKMELNSVVDYRLSSKNWTHIHFQLYAALDKPLVHLRNVQCWGQFPMVWNYETMPRTFAGEKYVNPSGALKQPREFPQRQIDYITVFYMDRFWNDSTETEWQQILEQDYRELHVSKRGKAALYKKVSAD